MKSQKIFLLLLLLPVMLQAQVVTLNGVTTKINSGLQVKVNGNMSSSTGSTLQTDGTLTIAGDLGNAGTVKGSGTLAYTGNLAHTGVVAPGNSPTIGKLTVTGNYNNHTGALNIDLGGATNAGTDYDQLAVSGSATLGGTLTVALVNSFNITPGQTFTILTASSISGTFTTTNLPSGVSVQYNATSVQLVTCTGLASSPGNVNITWTGLLSTDWNTACNWNPSWVPDVTNGLVIIPNTTNKPVITGTVPDVKVIEIQTDALVTNSNTGVLNVRGDGGTNKGIWINKGTLTNNNGGIINIQSASNSAINSYIYLTTDISNGATFNNSGTVAINSTDEAIGVGNNVGVQPANINNNATGIINVTNGIGVEVNASTDILNFQNIGTINYNGSVLALKFLGTTTFTNTGTVNINSGTGIENPSGSSIINNACGKILMASGTYTNGGTTINSGSIQLPNAYNFTTNTGTFNNNGVLKANTVSAITNNKMVITNACPIFTLGGTNNYTVSGIFTDEAATTSAGTYTPVGNKFTANNTLPSGTQTLYAQVSDGTCTLVVPFDLNNVLPTAVSVNNTAICTGTSVTLSATCASGTPNWYTNATGGTSIGTGASLSNSPTVPTTYHVACEATNCVSGRVATNAVSVSSLPAASANSNSPICAGATLNLNSGSEGNTYLWAGPNSFTSTELSPSIANATALATGTYSITVTNASSCTATATVAVTVNSVPAATASSNSIVCVGNSVSLTAGGVGTYLWTGPNGYSSTAQSPTITYATVSATGTYTITVTGTGSCTSTATTAVIVNANPTATASSSTPVICAGNSISLTSGGIGTYAWTGVNGFTSTDQNPSIPNATLLASGTYKITITNVNGCTSTATTSVTVNALPTATASSSTPVICAGNSISLTGGGVGTYAWAGPNGYTSTSQSPTIANATVLATGTYTITVTNANSCTSTATVAVTVNALPTATASSSTPVICVGNTISLSGGGIGTYEWTGVNGFISTDQNPSIPNVTVLASGTYKITVTNVNGCTSTAMTSITVNALPTATASSSTPVICVGNTISLSGGGIGTYEWMGVNGFISTDQNPSIPNATVLSSGTYKITVTNVNGCTSTAMTSVTVNANPTATASSNSPICAGVTLSLTGGGSGTYAWTGVNGFTSTDQNPSIPNATLLASGTYKITVTNVNGCTSTAMTSITVNALPTATASSSTPVICVGNSISLTSGGIGTYAWTGVNGFTSTDQNPSIPNASILASGTYKITVTNVNGCASTAMTSVTVNANPTATASSNSPICAGNSISLTGGGVGTYAWAGPNGYTSTSQSPTIATNATVLATGTYTITVTNANSCTSTATVTVTVNANPTATASSNSPICVGNNITLTGGGVGTYLWSGPNGYTSASQSPTIINATVLATGTYTITVTNINGCTSTATTSVTVNANPTATASNNSPICSGATLNLTGRGVGTSYAWTSSNGFTSTAQSPTIANSTVLATGTYTITVTNVNGCTSTATTSVTVNATPTATASNNSPICTGATLNLTGGGVGTYAWLGPSGYTSTAQSPSILSATASMSGTYTILVTNVNGCTSTATTSITVNPAIITPMPQANTQIIFGASITLTATGCSGVNDVLKWYKSSDNTLAVMPVSPTETTNYYAKCETTLNGITCISGNSTDVTVTVLQPQPPVATGATICTGGSVTLTATGCTGSTGTFVLKWYLNTTDVLVTMPVSPTTNTDYYAKCEQTFNSVTAISGKSNVVTVTVLNPLAPVATGGTIYLGNSITLTTTGCIGAGFSIKWYQTSDNLLVTMPVSPTVTTQYYTKCEQTANAVTCLSVKSNDVTVTVVNRIFVDISKVAAPIQNGNSWATAYGNLQTGLSAAAAVVVSAPAEVWVAQGTYKPTTTTTRTIYFNMPSNVKVYGGFTGTENALNDRNFRTNTTILSGDIGTINIASDNSHHVVIFDGSSNTTVLDGFTITGGYGNFDSKRLVNAPIVAPTTTTTIETGGGIVVQNAGSPIITNCIIVNNAAVIGGGIYASDASIPKIMACKIMSNQATFGGGVYYQNSSNGSISNSLISGNRGIGAVYNNNSNPTITNCTIAGNGGYNGGIFNSTSQPVVRNTIIWNNSTPFNDTQSIITYSTIQGGYAGTGNLNYDPKFVNPVTDGLSPTLNGDYHVQASSLAIDRGDNTGISLTVTDLDGNLRRYNGGTVDIGAYEFQGVATSNIVISAQTGDWEINSTWVGFKVPALGDVVIIDANHIVTINTTATAKSIEYRATGQVKFKTAATKLNIGF